MARYAIVENGKVANLINWDGVSQYPNSASLVIAPDHAYIGGDFSGGVFSAMQPVEDTLTYVEKRQSAYASIGDQLDMQYWDSVNDTTTWKDHIASVKAQFPKV